MNIWLYLGMALVVAVVGTTLMFGLATWNINGRWQWWWR